MSKNRKERISVHLSYLLRHDPNAAELNMDRHGWVDVSKLIQKVNSSGKYSLSMDLLKEIVETDNKGRYRFSPDGKRIKACQGHSIPWVEPELEIQTPPKYLFHGTNTEALDQIMKTGAILRMKRHAVHMQADPEKAWKSAKRWKGKTPVVLKIAAQELGRTGMTFGVSDNEVWCCEQVPTAFIAEFLYESSR